jgi:hypothetical protein
MINKMTLSASFTPGQDLPSNERVHARFNYERYDWKVALKYNPADFYDLFGPTKVSRKGYSAAVGYNKGLISDEPRHLDISAVAAFFGNIDRLPSYQNIQATFDKLSVAEARLTYRDIRSSLGAVDSEKGLMAEAIAGFQYEDGTFIPNLVGNFDFGIPLPLRSSSVWLRTSLGAAHGDVENPFANFYFGGFGNNYVDHAEVKRYRQWYSFPGVPLNSIGGTNFAKAMVEWNLPPLRFRKAGTPGFYASWMRTSIFATGIETNLDQSEFRRKVGDVGAQLDFRFIALSRQPLTLSIGYATAFESGQPSQDEFMISLKVLR